MFYVKIPSRLSSWISISNSHLCPKIRKAVAVTEKRYGQNSPPYQADVLRTNVLAMPGGFTSGGHPGGRYQSASRSTMQQ
jgi:hypothetical protein